MEKKAAESLIKDTFNAKFNLEQYTLFMRNLLNDYDEDKEREWAQGNYIYESFREHINKFKRLGIYTDPEGNEIELLVIETKATSKLERARTSLRNFVIKRLNDKNRDYALAAFYSKEDNGEDWRFSYIKIEHESYKDQKGKVKTKKELTPAKRFSFLVGEHEHAYTAQKQLLPVLQNDYSNPNVEDLENCFSIEKVTDEFFEQYKELYLKLSEHFSNDKSVQKILITSGIGSNRFTKKLLGQIVFLYFLQKKGWLGVPKNEPWGKGEKKFMQSLYDEAISKKQNFFKDYLQYLFYEALAKARTSSPDPSYYKRFDCKIPFLNGGLFEADYDWQNVNLSIPNNLFRNDEKNKAGDKGTGILDVFDRYNFTIKEDEPLEKEVAVDPEMLGKVFENMLEITERKSKGAFYTPREIVHYMCQESLINYLDNAINDATQSYQSIDSDQLRIFEGAADKKGQAKIEIQHKGKILIPKEDIELFVHKGFLAAENDLLILEKGKETSTYRFQLPESVRVNADILDEKLTSIKICDPAIGSGAFPVGLLHELVTAQKVLLSHLSEKYLNEKLQKIGLEKQEYKKDSAKYIYRAKRHAIQESIYGVDIDASAIDIARLRLWLSLIVDEEDFYSIEALPNLDYKIVKGSSLIGLAQGAMKDLNAEAEMEKLKGLFFNETNEVKKRELRTEINTKIRQLLNHAEQFAGYKIEFDFKLYFSEVWHEKNGFDIVIGNPPYVRVQEIEKSTATILKRNYASSTGSFDLYLLFAEKGSLLINKNGTVSYIMPHKWTNSSYGEGFRGFLNSEKLLARLISFDSFQVFTASTYTSIIFLNKKSDNFQYVRLKNDLKSLTELENFLNALNDSSYTIYSRNIGTEPLKLLDPDLDKVLKTASRNTVRLGTLAKNIFQGLKTSKDSVYVLKDVSIKNEKLLTGYSEELDELVQIEVKICRPLLKGSDFHRYDVINTDKVVILPYKVSNLDYRLYTKDELEKEFPLAYKYLLRNKEVLRNREDGKLKNDLYWYRFIYPKNILLFPKEKIIISEVSYGSNMTLDINGIHHVGQYSLILREPTHQKYLSTLLVLNSEFMWFFIKNTSSVLRGGYYAYRPDYMNPFPFPILGEKTEEVFSKLAQYLIILKKVNAESVEYKFFEALGNAIVYEKYFQKQFEKAQKELIKHLTILVGIESLIDDNKKMKALNLQFRELYDPNHPVRNNLETLDSVEEVRIIKEALK